ncbi:MAG: S8 family serine peptidase [Sulfitobacter sp.]
MSFMNFAQKVASQIFSDANVQSDADAAGASFLDMMMAQADPVAGAEAAVLDTSETQAPDTEDSGEGVKDRFAAKDTGALFDFMDATSSMKISASKELPALSSYGSAYNASRTDGPFGTQGQSTILAAVSLMALKAATGSAPTADANGEYFSLNMALPTDGLFSAQWHLRNTSAGQLDLNVEDVWESNSGGANYTGNGVRVAVIDDSLDRNHKDLNGNVDVGSDWDFYDNDTNPTQVLSSDEHGTSVAGIIGSERDGVGTVGVAYDITLFGFRVKSAGEAGDTLATLLDDFVSQITSAIDEASGNGTIAGAGEADVVNMSNGTQISTNLMDLGMGTPSLMNTLEVAINNAAEDGRGGLGTNIVKSAGNGRGSDHDANLSSWNANIHTISVAAVDRDGDLSSYSTKGSNVLVSGFGSPTSGQVVTTDVTGSGGYNSGQASQPADQDYTNSFNGTSAAAPMVSGVVALMLEANDQLGWRDVQEILANSARHVGTDVGAGINGAEQNAWAFNNAAHWNGGGMHFSKDYGFGLVDAHAAVRMAETWGTDSQTSANDVIAFEDIINGSETIDGVVNGGNTAVTSGVETYSWTETANVRIEQVTLDVAFETTWLGDLEITVVSPDGTTHLVIADMWNNASTNWGDNDGLFDSNERWTFSTNAFWGEESGGVWSVIIRDDSGGDETLFTDFDVRMHGATSLLNNDRFVFTDEFSDYDGLFGHSTSAFAGGVGDDTINAAAVTGNTTINLVTDTGTIDGVAVTNLSSIENVFTGDGNDTVTGDSSVTNVSTGRGNDRLISSGTGAWDAGAGNDFALSGLGIEQMDGGDGFDYIDHRAFNGNYLFNMDSGATNYAGESFTNFEVAYMGEGNDTVIGTANRDYVYAFGGNDSITGNAGGDYLYGYDGNDTIDGGADNDYINGLNDNDSLIGGAGDDTIYGGSGNDVVLGGTGTDTLFGGNGDDTLNGGLFKDSVNGDAGNDLFQITGGDFGDDIDGGADNDTLDLSGWTNAAIAFDVDLGAGTYEYLPNGFGVNGEYILLNVENVIGSDFNDVIRGSSGVANLLNGGAGNDTITAVGLSDVDTVNGGAGNDVIFGGLNAQVLNGDAGNDTIYGDDATPASGVGDTIDGGAGNDSIVGANGADMVIGGTGSDTLIGNNGNDTLQGGDASDSAGSWIDGGIGDDLMQVRLGNNDTLIGGNGSDTVQQMISGTFISTQRVIDIDQGYQFAGGAFQGSWSGIENFIAGDDFQLRIIGNGSANMLQGSSLGDTIEGENGDDTLLGLAGDDSIDGGTGVDSMIGGDGNDTLDGGISNDIALGGLGDDLMYMRSGDGADSFNGGGGNDTVDFTNTGVSVNANLIAGNYGYGGPGVFDMIDVENVFGGTGNDTIVGSNGDNAINGGLGNDNIDAGFGDDTVFAGDGTDRAIMRGGNDYADGGAGNDLLVGAGGDDTLLGGDDNDRLVGAGGASGSNVANNDVLGGGNGNDTIFGSDGDDNINGGADDDIIRGNDGNDTIDGGTGTDRISYYNATGAVTVNLLSGTASGGDGNDVISGVEDIDGSNGFGDYLVGGSGDSRINGYNGNDTIFGANGNDVLIGDDGDDVIYGAGSATGGAVNMSRLDGGTGMDTLYGSDGADTLLGGEDGDVLVGNGGNDVMNGGGGTNDRASYIYASGGVTVNLTTGTASGAEGNDVLAQIEWADGGSFADSLTGNGVANWLFGRDGEDTIDGAGGNDTIIGGADDDLLTGGAGFDRFEFGNGFGDDIIVDFDSHNAEDIDLRTSTNITSFADLMANHLVSFGGDALIVDGIDSILLQGVAFGDVGIGQLYSADDFLF